MLAASATRDIAMKLTRSYLGLTETGLSPFSISYLRFLTVKLDRLVLTVKVSSEARPGKYFVRKGEGKDIFRTQSIREKACIELDKWLYKG